MNIISIINSIAESSKYCIVAIPKELSGVAKLLGIKAYEICNFTFLRPYGYNTYSKNLYELKGCDQNLKLSLSNNHTEVLFSITEHCVPTLKMTFPNNIDDGTNIEFFKVLNNLFLSNSITGCKVVNCIKEDLIEAYYGMYNSTIEENTSVIYNTSMITSSNQYNSSQYNENNYWLPLSTNYVPLAITIGAVATVAIPTVIACYLKHKNNALEALNRDLTTKLNHEYDELPNLDLLNNQIYAEPLVSTVSYQTKISLIPPIYASIQKKNKLSDNQIDSINSKASTNSTTALSTFVESNDNDSDNTYDDIVHDQEGDSNSHNYPNQEKNEEHFELQKNPIYNEVNNDLLGITLDSIYS
ncbi:Uncharacterised protein [Orientia tsutsugamushi]|uniref:hypothetical protein n=1 Tax=Orientia tsutsugamushi TaxID=784 RepID=UPI00061F7BE8|nr:hypothetical protein [Orientia tsutsugamushi]KJV74610.1 hypothetical protein OTSTA763_0987 [Orientia tsutsugamushi str. TA763]SPP24667.1 Uncharacterised protein [Orientia tsutsugamushi]